MDSIESENELLDRLAKNDSKTVEAIYRDHYGMIQAFVVKNNGSEEDARDIFQEAVTVLYEKACSDDFALSCSIGTYLYAVSKRLWLKKLNRSARNVVTKTNDFEDVAGMDTDLDYFEKMEAKFKVMKKALDHLGEPCKTLIKSFYIKQKSMADIAEDFGYTNADNAKTQKYKCLQRLKKIYFLIFKEEN